MLKNITGMWILEQCIKEWKKEGVEYSYPEIVKMAEGATPFQSFIDPDDPSFANPPSMTAAIREFCSKSGQPVPQSHPELIRCIFESLAIKYKDILEKFRALAPFPIEKLHVIGGGSKNKLLDLGNASGEQNYESAGASGVGDYVHAKNGEVWPYFYGRKTDGIFQNWDEVNSYVNKDGELLQPNAQPGDVRFVDVTSDGVINDQDRTKIGKGMPDWTFGFSLGAEWKGFDLSLSFQGTLGNDVFDFAQRGDVPAMNRPSWIMDRWHGEGTSNRIPRMTSANPNGNWTSSDLYIHDGSYLRLKNAQIGYTLPATLTRKASIQRLRLYVGAENLITITGYEGFDPELASGGYTTLGVDKGIYPQSRTITVGANITF